MRAFIVLSFVVAAASAAGLGYTYGPGISGTIENSGSRNVYQSGGSKLIGGGLLGTSSGGLLSNTYSTNSGGLIGGGRIVGGGGLIGGGKFFGGGGLNYQSGGGINYHNGGGFLSGGAINGGSRVVGIGSLHSIPQTVELSKQYFHFNAPEQYRGQGQNSQQVSNVLKKNLQVVFIRAPENNDATNAALQLAKQAVEQKTVIYVLTKQNDGAQLAAQIQQIQERVPTTPEVRFIKYKTPEDIAIAKQQIQSQYDNLGGSSQVIDGGVAPVLNYASGGSSNSGSSSLLGLGQSSGIGSSIVSGGGSSIVSGGGSNYGTEVVSDSGSSYGSDYVSNSGSSYSSGIGSSTLSGSGDVNYVSEPTKPDYLPPNPLKK